MSKGVAGAVTLALWAGAGAAQTWSHTVMDPNDPPYLSGAAARAVSRDGEVRLDYTCTTEGETLMLDGGVVARLPSPAYVMFFVDGYQAGQAVEMTEYEGALFGTPDRALLDGLAGGSTLDVYLAGTTNNFTSFGLGGSSAALRAARAACG